MSIFLVFENVKIWNDKNMKYIVSKLDSLFNLGLYRFYIYAYKKFMQFYFLF